ncbi:MAG: hypothetical protein SF052_25195 [Bacteroidia bacterium]|nr:hypothetical protein [Bacteroidia bacterium]
MGKEKEAARWATNIRPLRGQASPGTRISAALAKPCAAGKMGFGAAGTRQLGAAGTSWLGVAGLRRSRMFVANKPPPNFFPWAASAHAIPPTASPSEKRIYRRKAGHSDERSEEEPLRRCAGGGLFFALATARRWKFWENKFLRSPSAQRKWEKKKSGRRLATNM